MDSNNLLISRWTVLKSVFYKPSPYCWGVPFHSIAVEYDVMARVGNCHQHQFKFRPLGRELGRPVMIGTVNKLAVLTQQGRERAGRADLVRREREIAAVPRDAAHVGAHRHGRALLADHLRGCRVPGRFLGPQHQQYARSNFRDFSD